jgi:Protein of unknown function (DUF229).
VCEIEIKKSHVREELYNTNAISSRLVMIHRRRVLTLNACAVITMYVVISFIGWHQESITPWMEMEVSLIVRKQQFSDNSSQPTTLAKTTSDTFLGRKPHKSCVVTEIVHRFVADIDNSEVSCQPHIPLESGCLSARESLKYEPEKYECKKENKVNLCSQVKNSLKFNCTGAEKVCELDDVVHIYRFELENGPFLNVTATSKTGRIALEHVVRSEAKKAIESLHRFLFISCSGRVDKTQLLPLKLEKHDKERTREEESRTKNIDNNEKERVNVNLLLLDSISRSHFYRSLRRTINFFNKTNVRGDPKSSEILDFELFQSIHGASQENTYALMTGKTFTEQQKASRSREEEPVELDKFYGFLKKNGYETLYQDDMCFAANYGLRRDLGGLRETWYQFNKRLNKESNIDDYGKCLLYRKSLNYFGYQK